MEAVAVQDNDTEASHVTTMEDISMDERAAIVEGTETCQGEITIEDGSVSNGIVDADGAQARGAEGVSDAQNAQLVGSNGSMDSRGIAEAEARLGAAEDVGAGNFVMSPAPANNKPENWGSMSKSQRRHWHSKMQRHKK